MHVASGLVALLMALGVTACTPRHARPADGTGPEAPLLRPATLGATRDADQLLRAAFGERDLSLRCVVAADAERLTVVGLMPTGQRVFTLAWDGARIDAQADLPGGLSALEPRWMLRDLQFALWPETALQAGYAPASKWTFSVPQPGVRRLRRDGRLFAEAHYSDAGGDPWGQRIAIVNFEYGYSLVIQPLIDD